LSNELRLLYVNIAFKFRWLEFKATYFYLSLKCV